MYPLFLTFRLNVVFIPSLVFNEDELILEMRDILRFNTVKEFIRHNIFDI